ncbi:hypothetical protein L873DRAFT_1804376, partial [Choiromyces venosus 120613-1]
MSLPPLPSAGVSRPSTSLLSCIGVPRPGGFGVLWWAGRTSPCPTTYGTAFASLTTVLRNLERYNPYLQLL